MYQYLERLLPDLRKLFLAVKDLNDFFSMALQDTSHCLGVPLTNKWPCLASP